MQGGDTSLGGDRRSFPQTTWSLVSKIKNEDGASRRAGLEDLGRRYWKPVYRYLRIAWAKSNDDAKDLAQAFLLWVVEGDALALYDPQRGSFRTYLTLLLDRFSIHQDRAMKRLKRGGGVRILPLDADLAALQEKADPAAADPRAIFDQAWMEEVVRQATDRVRARYEGGPAAIQFKVFERHALVDPDRRPGQAALAAELGISESDVRNYLFRIREAVREEIRAELLDQAFDQQSFDEDWNAFFGG